MTTEKPDIVERLRKNTDKYPGFENLNTEAAAEIERLRADTVILADTIRRLLEAQPLGKLWREIIPTMHADLRGAVERAESLPTKINPPA